MSNLVLYSTAQSVKMVWFVTVRAGTKWIHPDNTTVSPGWADHGVGVVGCVCSEEKHTTRHSVQCGQILNGRWGSVEEWSHLERAVRQAAGQHVTRTWHALARDRRVDRPFRIISSFPHLLSDFGFQHRRHHITSSDITICHHIGGLFISVLASLTNGVSWLLHYYPTLHRISFDLIPFRFITIH